MCGITAVLSRHTPISETTLAAGTAALHHRDAAHHIGRRGAKPRQLGSDARSLAGDTDGGTTGFHGPYLGSMAKGGKGCQPSGLSAKPVTALRTIDQRSGRASGM